MKKFYTHIFIICCMPFASKAGDNNRALSPHKPHTQKEWADHLQAHYQKPRIFPIYPWNQRNLVAIVHAAQQAPALPVIKEE